MLVDIYDVGLHLLEKDPSLPPYMCSVWMLTCFYLITTTNHNQLKDKQLIQVGQNSSQRFLKLRIKILSLSSGARSMR